MSLVEPVHIHQKPTTKTAAGELPLDPVCGYSHKRRETLACLPKISSLESRLGKLSMNRRHSLFVGGVIHEDALLLVSDESRENPSEITTPNFTRPPSVTPEPDIIREVACSSPTSCSPEVTRAELPPLSYRPKYCWCKHVCFD